MSNARHGFRENVRRGEGAVAHYEPWVVAAPVVVRCRLSGRGDVVEHAAEVRWVRPYNQAPRARPDNVAPPR